MYRDVNKLYENVHAVNMMPIYWICDVCVCLCVNM